MVTMIILTALLASWVVGSVQGTRVAYVAVRADKADYSVGENVTFSLVPLSKDVQFTVTGAGTSGGVLIVRLPDNIDPETYLDDPNALGDVGGFNFYHGGVQAVVPLPEYNSSGEPLRLSWNGTFQDHRAGGAGWELATAGNYLLYPVYSWEYGHATKFILERASIFHLSGLGIKINVSLEDSAFTVRADLTLPAGAQPISGLFSAWISELATGSNTTEGYHNETLMIRPGELSTVVLTYPAQANSDGPATTTIVGRFIVGETIYIFGIDPYLVMQMNGQWEVHYVQF